MSHTDHTDSAPTSSRLQELVDRQDIWDCICRCARGMDRHDPELIATAYHPDGYDDHGTFRGTASDFIEWCNGSPTDAGVHFNYTVHQHLVLNHVVDLRGDEAHCETHYLFFGELRAVPAIQAAGGRYIDYMTRENGRWAIKRRRVVMEWTVPLPSPTDMSSDHLQWFTRGTWDRTDVSYQRPVEVRPPHVV